MKKINTLLILFACYTSYAQTADTSFTSYDQKMPGSVIKFKMLPIKGGNFTMGSPESEKGRTADEGPQKPFSISSFWMGACEVTHDEFNLFFMDASVSQDSETDAITRPSPQ
ncbi:MAG: SUMF1/EgtB/PvdO family nonheme iron enzyme, partial [Bacteroidota bacterium]|nr:SUMF1/EgtB/PvdO family nonheme iron enzyme [Bacteroidota bacterium]